MSAHDGAEQRHIELEQHLVELKNVETAVYDKILEDIKKRDYNDSHREIAPLKPADDGIIVDTTELTLDESIEKIREIISGMMN